MPAYGNGYVKEFPGIGEIAAICGARAYPPAVQTRSKAQKKITANGQFSHRMETILDEEPLRLSKAARFGPDMMGYSILKSGNGERGVKLYLFTVEVKMMPEAGGYWQAKKYVEILQADWGFLLSGLRPSQDFTGYLSSYPNVASCSNGGRTYIGVVSPRTRQIVEWIPHFDYLS